MIPGNESKRRWLVATDRGLYAGEPGGRWELQGGYAVRLTSILRQSGRTVVGGGAGLWEIPSDGSWWVQLHDETLTEVIGLAALPGDPGLLVASAYGVATGQRDDIDVVRWSFHLDSLPPDDRFTNAAVITEELWVAGTEQGVLTMKTGSDCWRASDLRGTPVRTLVRLRGQLWAGSDRRGVWRSDDGVAGRRPALVWTARPCSTWPLPAISSWPPLSAASTSVMAADAGNRSALTSASERSAPQAHVVRKTRAPRAIIRHTQRQATPVRKYTYMSPSFALGSTQLSRGRPQHRSDALLAWKDVASARFRHRPGFKADPHARHRLSAIGRSSTTRH